MTLKFQLIILSRYDKDLEDTENTPDLTPAYILEEQADDHTFKAIPDIPVLPISSTSSSKLPNVNVIAATPIHITEEALITSYFPTTQHDRLEEELLDDDLV